MIIPRSLVLLLPALDFTSAVNIFVSHFTGSVVTLSLTPQSNGAYSIAQSSSLTIGAQPSWMTFNSTTRTIYVSDETGSGPSSLFALKAGPNGVLTLSGKAPALVGGVATGIYADGSFIASAHYNPSTVTTFKLPITSSSRTLQSIKFTMVGTGPDPARQDAPHPHATFIDPTGRFLLVPDLGADQIRIFSINKDTGFLTTCPSGISTPGNGPRHGVFSGETLYIANELSHTVDAFSVSYPATGCLELTKKQTLKTRPGNATLPVGTKVGEIHIKDQSLYVSNRRDGLFSGNDSIAHFSLGCAGNMTFEALTPSGGTYPRTFQINKAGDLVAIADQTTANVVVVKRNTKTGRLGDQVANIRVGAVGTPESEDGISAVIWDE